MPVKIEKKGNEWCVIEPDGSTVACHDTEKKALAQMRAINANKEDKEADTENKHMHQIVPYGATSFEEVDVAHEARERSQAILELTYNYTDLVWNVVNQQDAGNSTAALKKLNDDFTTRLEALSSAEQDDDSDMKEADEDNLIKKVMDAVGNWIGYDPEKRALKSIRDGDNDMLIWKDKGGTYRWVARYSNNFRDDDKPPEIISSDSHRKFVTMVNAGLAPLPKLWLWHVKEWEFGQSDWVAYDESGFAVAGGYIYDDPACVALAKSISKMDDVRVSHGMPKWSITRNISDPTVIEEHVTQEISPLPGWAAANKLTGFNVLLGAQEKEGMAFTKEDKKKLIDQHNVSPGLIETLEALNAKDAGVAEDLGIESKDVGAEEIEPKEEALGQEEEVATEDKDVEAEAEAKDTVELKDLEFVVDALKQTMEAVAANGNQIKELVEAMGELKQADEERVAKQAQFTPFASQLAMMNQSVIGKEAAKVDGRTTLAKSAPAEADPKPHSITGIPLIDQWVN